METFNVKSRIEVLGTLLRPSQASHDPCSALQRFRFAKRSDVNTPNFPSRAVQTTIAPPQHAIMASAVKKKLVVCGGNGFLGMYIAYQHSLKLF